jgi:hypothetical protein
VTAASFISLFFSSAKHDAFIILYFTLLMQCGYTPMAAARHTNTVPAPASKVRVDVVLSAPPDGEAEGDAATLDATDATDDAAEEDELAALLLALLLMLLILLLTLLPLALELPDTGTVTETAGRVVGEMVAEAHWFR